MPVVTVMSFWRSFSAVGLIIGALFFAASLTPSLIPRTYLTQGALAGVAFAAGYGVGVLLDGLWEYMELPRGGLRWRRGTVLLAAAAAVVIVGTFLARSAAWQNSIRERVDMEPVTEAHGVEVAAIALAVSVVLILLARLFRSVFRTVARWLDRIVPPKVSRVIGIAVTLVLFAAVVDGVLLRGLLRTADRSFAALDALIEPDVAQPADPGMTGSAASLVAWEGMGRAGREYVASGPSRADIEAFTGEPAMDPLRIYVGLNSADDPEARAALALEEMIRTGAFDRKVLVVAVPTGTGWMDPAAMDTLEYLQRGDVATVAVQYSYLTSPITMLVEPGYGVEAGRALFRAVYSYWTELPPDARPRLYLHGLSLGSASSEQSVRLHEVLADPIQGAVWSGPPFTSPIHSSATRNRQPGTPEWLPLYGDASIVRFTNQENHLDIPGAAWGPMRIVYLQYASDPIVFFSTDTLWREPDWMAPPRGPDVSDELRWYPVVTFLQLLLDMAVGLAVPIGHGHLYAHAHYIDAWVAVTEPAGWNASEIARLKAHFVSP